MTSSCPSPATCTWPGAKPGHGHNDAYDVHILRGEHRIDDQQLYAWELTNASRLIILFLALVALAIVAQLWAVALVCGGVAAYLYFAAGPEAEGGRRSVLLDPTVNITMSVAIGLAVIAALLVENQRFLLAGIIGVLAGFAGVITAYIAWQRSDD